MNIEKLPRAPMRREDEPGYDREIWQPSWNCFCCHDTGIVNPNLAALAIEGYSYELDKLPRCVNPGCSAGSDWDRETLANCIDYRISAATCLHLDALERENWQRTILTNREQIQNRIADTAKTHSIRQHDRTWLEEDLAARRHEEILNADSQLLREMARDYLGDKWMEDGSA